MHADLYCAPEGCRRLPDSLFVTLALVPGGTALSVPERFFAESAVTCGMSGRDTLSFSSVGETHAMLCLMRSVPFGPYLFEPSEWRVDYDPACTLYENLTRAFGTVLFDHILGKEHAAIETVCQ